MSNIIVIAEARSGQVKKPSLEAVGAAVELAAKSGGQVIAIVAGSDLDAAKDLLANSGAHKVIAVQSADLANYSGTAYANAITAQINSLDAGAILMPHSATVKVLFDVCLTFLRWRKYWRSSSSLI